MAHSFLIFREKNLITKDSDIVLFFSILKYTDNKISFLRSENLKKLINHWLSLDVYGPGTLNINFDEYIKNSEDRANIISLIDLSLTEVSHISDENFAEFANKVVESTEVIKFIKLDKYDFIEILNKIKEFLLEG